MEGSVEIRRPSDHPDPRRELMADARRGLTASPKELPPRWFYDARGSCLFDRITRLPEYYQTRAERAILERVGPPWVESVRPGALVEFGSGSAEKTRLLLDAMERLGLLACYAPIDVSEAALGTSARSLAAAYPGLRVVGLIGDFRRPLELPCRHEVRLVAFLGSTIGNLRQEHAEAFLGRVARQLATEDRFLIGFDLVKDRARLEAAYNDAQGVTAAFNLNVLRVLNRELGADFDLEAFRHRALWNEEERRIEMHLVALRPHTVRLAALELEVAFAEGETIRTELSHKYTRRSASRLLSAAGLELRRWETDPDELFALGLARA